MPAPRSLDVSLVRGIAWTSAVRWATQMATWVITLAVARILSPADYGVFGMAMVYLGVAQLASEAGLLPAIVQPRELASTTAAQLGTLAAAVGVVMALLSAVASWPVAAFYREPRVQPLFAALGLTFVLRGAQVLPRGLLTRDLDFRRLAWLDAGEAIAAAGATLGFALAGAGYWALAVGALVGLLVSTPLAWWWRPHRLGLPRRTVLLGASVKTGWYVMVSQFAWYAYTNADFAVVGRMLGRAALGAYSLAWTIANVPVDRITSAVGRVTAPVFASVQGDRTALGRYLGNLTEGLSLVTFPICAGVAALADLLVPVLLGPAWSAAVMPLRLLALYAMVRCVTVLLSQLLIFAGESRTNMHFSVLGAAVLIPSFAVGAHWGVTGVAAAWAIVYSLVVAGVYLRASLRCTGLTARRFASSLRVATLGTGVMVVALTLARPAVASLPSWAELLSLTLIGAVAYAVVVVPAAHARARVVLGMLRGRPMAPGDGRVMQDVEVTGDVVRPRLLLISWHFPPDPAVGGVRWEQLARHAARRGWAVDVVTRDMSQVAGRDPGRLDLLPAGTRIYEVPSPSIRSDAIGAGVVRVLRSVRRAVRGATGATSRVVQPNARGSGASVPRDAMRWPLTPAEAVRSWHALTARARDRAWAAAASRTARSVLDERHVAVVTCGPPHAAHEAGERVVRGTRLPLIADLRDPWSLVERLPAHLASRLALWRASRDEARVAARAALVVMNTPAARDAMRARYARQATRIIAVPNGVDDDAIPPPVPGNRFTIAYAGTIYLDRDPRPLLRAVRRVADATGLGPDAFGVEFMGDAGSYDGTPLDELARLERVDAYVTLHPPAPRAVARAFLARASMLVVLPQDSALAVPAKLFEYLRYPAWILACAEPGSATAAVLAGIDADCAGPLDVDAIAAAIDHRLMAFRRGDRPSPAGLAPHLSRRVHADRLFDAIAKAAGVAPHAAPRHPPAVTPAVTPAAEPARAAASGA